MRSTCSTGFDTFQKSNSIWSMGTEWVRICKFRIPLVNSFLSGGEPFNVLEEIEEFLGIEKFLVKEKFVTNEKTGFYCFEKDPGLEPICLSDDKVGVFIWVLFKISFLVAFKTRRGRHHRRCSCPRAREILRSVQLRSAQDLARVWSSLDQVNKQTLLFEGP